MRVVSFDIVVVFWGIIYWTGMEQQQVRRQKSRFSLLWKIWMYILKQNAMRNSFVSTL